MPELGLDIVEEINKMGYAAEVFVVRVEGVLDIFLPSGKWHDLRTHERGRRALHQIPGLISERMEMEWTGKKQQAG